MPGLEGIGRWLVMVGVLLVVIGGAIWLLGKAFPNLSQFPGTLRIQTGNVTCIFPVLAMIIISVVLTIVLNLFSHFLK